MNKKKLTEMLVIAALLVMIVAQVEIVHRVAANPTWLFISVISPENKTYSTNEIPLIFGYKSYSADETVSWMGYSLDSQKVVSVAGNSTLSGLSNGLHSIIVYANDSFGLMEHSGTVNFTVVSQATVSPSPTPEPSSTIEPTSTPQPQLGFLGSRLPLEYCYAIIAILAIIVVGASALYYFKKHKHYSLE